MRIWKYFRFGGGAVRHRTNGLKQIQIPIKHIQIDMRKYKYK